MTRRHLLPWLALLLLCGVALTPLLRGTITCSHDGDLHIHRVTAMRHALRSGLLYSRWMPDLAFGYGYPFFNYREPFSYYLTLGLHLTGLPLPWALNLVYVLSLLASAAGAYLLARDLLGPRAAFVAAAAYVYAPYQFLDALLRGNLLESVALGLFPLILWAFRRLALTGRRRWFVTATGLLTLLLLSHNISSLLFVPFLSLYLLVLGWAYGRKGHWVRAGLALALALGLTAFFWIPALAEQRYVQLHMSRTTRNNDFHYNFLGPAEIFAPPAAFDTSLINPPMEIHLGLVAAVLAVVGVGRLIMAHRGRSIEGGKGREWWASGLFFAAFGLIFLFMATPASLWLWEHVPLLPFVQFPWRLVGRAALPVALLAAYAFARPPADPASRSRLLLPGLLLVLALLILVALPATYPPLGYCPAAPYPTIQDVHRYEHESRLVGVDPEGSYFPIWVEQRPEGSPLEAQYAAGGEIARFDPATVPEGGALLEAEYHPNRARLVIDSPQPFRARYRTFHFPGWRVWVDGELVEITPSDPEGLITFDVPAGRHEVRLRFGETNLRRAGDLLSLLALVAFAALGVWLPQPSGGERVRQPAQLELRTVLLLAGLGLLLLGVKSAWVDRMETPFRRPALQAGSSLPGIDHPLHRPYTGNMLLIGYDQEQVSLPADGDLRVDLYWTAPRQATRRVQSTVYLVDEQGFLWSPENSYPPRGSHRPPPAYTWDPERYAIDRHVVEPLEGTPPGIYRVVMTLFDRDSLAPLSVLDTAGRPAAPELVLGEVSLTRPRRPATPPDRARVALPLGPFTLHAADFDRGQAAPGDSVYLDLLWEAGQAVDTPYTATLSLSGVQGAPAATYPVAAPAVAWQVGDVWRSRHRLTLPASLESGVYTWTVQGQALEPDGTAARLAVDAPPHTFDAPAVDVEADVQLGGLATLVGALVEPAPGETGELPALSPGEPLSVTLVWRAERTPAASYHVFLHLLDGEGRPVAQSDGIPAGWLRPTTGWLPGEVILDEHVLILPPDLPPGSYALSAGLYLPGGDRLRTPDGRDGVFLLELRVRGP